MERSVGNIKEMLRENVARFLEHADGREVIVSVTARLVKKQSEEQKRMEKDSEIEQSKSNATDKTPSKVSKSTTVSSQDNSSGIDWYGKGKDRYHYGKE